MALSPAQRISCLPPFRNWWRDTTSTLGHTLAVRWSKLLHLHKLLSCISGFLPSLKVLSSSTTAIKTNVNSMETLQAWADAVHSCNACKLRTFFCCLSLLAVLSLCSDCSACCCCVFFFFRWACYCRNESGYRQHRHHIRNQHGMILLQTTSIQILFLNY